MKKIKYFGFPILLMVIMSISTLPFQSCEPDCDDEDPCDSCSMVYKPNIYLYPTEQMQLQLILNFPVGGEVVTSIPEYGTGWNVNVEPDGLIDKSYAYLFYESLQPDIWQTSEGWLVNNEELESFFRVNMGLYGFYGQEIHDFTDYWIPRLTAESYAIYPQTASLIDNVIELNFSVKPDNVLRLFYVIQENDSTVAPVLAEPATISTFTREGFFVTEWGVLLK